MLCAVGDTHSGLKAVFCFIYVTPSNYHHYADLPTCIGHIRWKIPEACLNACWIYSVNSEYKMYLVLCRNNTGFVPTLNLPHQNRLCVDTKPAFLFWINISTVSEVRCDCQGLGLVARIEASISVFDTMQVLYWPVLGLIQFCSFDRRCKTCLDTKPVLYQDRFCSLTYVSALTKYPQNYCPRKNVRPS